MRYGCFSALSCGCAYGGWTCFDGFVRLGAVSAGIVIRGVVLFVAVRNFVRVATGYFLDRLAFPFQFAHVRFESRLEFALSTAKLSDRLSDRPAQLRQLLRAEEDQGNQENHDHLLHTHGTHTDKPPDNS